jgi:hypothetical protein
LAEKCCGISLLAGWAATTRGPSKHKNNCPSLAENVDLSDVLFTGVAIPRIP